MTLLYKEADGDETPIKSITIGGEEVPVHDVEPPSAVQGGMQTAPTAGTAVPLWGSSIPLRRGVRVRALSANTGIVRVGSVSLGLSSLNGYQLAAGESVFVDVADLATVYFVCTVNGEGVTFLGS